MANAGNHGLADVAQTHVRYPEKRLQLASVAELTRARHYHELYDDAEATGSRVDSIGMLDGRLWLIEYKVNVTGPMVRHAPGKGSNLESKISGTLGPLYRRSLDPVSKLCNAAWNRSSPPVFAIIAKSVSASAREQLRELYDERGQAWLFELVALEWDGKCHTTVFDGRLGSVGRASQYDGCLVETQQTSQARRKNMTLQQAMARAEDVGVGELFAAFVTEARTHGVRLKGQVDSVSGAQSGRNPATILGCYFGRSNATHGLHVGLENDAFALDVDALGAPAPIEGYIQSNRYLASIDDVRLLFEALKPAG